MSKAEEYVISCVRRAHVADNQEMVEPVLRIKMNRPLSRKGDFDYPEDAVVVSYDEANNRIHLYFMCSKTYKSIIMEVFGLSNHDFVSDDIGHISFDTPEMPIFISQWLETLKGI
jgi:hypothetical protein